MSIRDGRGWPDHMRMLWCFFEAAYPEAAAWAAVDFISADLKLGIRGADIWIVPADPGGDMPVFDDYEWEFHRRICRCGVNWWETVRPWWAASDPRVCCKGGQVL